MRRRGYLLLGSVAAGFGGLLTTSLVSAEPNPPTVGRVAPPTVAGSTATSAAPAATSAAPAATPTPSAPPALQAGPVRVKVDGFVSWAMLDRRTGEITGSSNLAATNSAESMIKIWIVSDFLRRSAERRTEPSQRRLRQGRAAIVDSDDNAAQSLYVSGGRDAVVERMIEKCRLTDTKIAGPGGVGDRGWWSYTRISARDAVRLGECVKDGTAAGTRWTAWVLQQMRDVRGSATAADQHARRGGGRWGIIDGLPATIRDRQAIGIKNGWTLINADLKWHLNCLAVADDWILAVLMRYPGERGLKYGASVCSSVARQLMTPAGAHAS